MAAKKEEGQGNIVSRGIGFSQDSYSELKKIHFPGREETIRWTIAAFMMLFFFAIFLGATDWIVGAMMKNILT